MLEDEILQNFLNNAVKNAKRQIEEEGKLTVESAIPLLLQSQFNHILHLDKELSSLRILIDERFEKMEGRFEKIDERFEKMEGRFEKIDERFEKMEGRFEKIDERFEKMEGRFEKIDERFEKMEGRFEKMEGRFEKVTIKLEWLLGIVIGLISLGFTYIGIVLSMRG
ncbi:MAG: hypothetical protein AB1414_04900 [bacterium]